MPIVVTAQIAAMIAARTPILPAVPLEETDPKSSEATSDSPEGEAG
jgi:hypothetical protein